MVGLRNFICSCRNILGTSFVPVGTQFVPDFPSLDFHLNNYYFIGMEKHYAYPIHPDSEKSIWEIYEELCIRPFTPDFSRLNWDYGVPLSRQIDRDAMLNRVYREVMMYGQTFVNFVWNGVSWPRLQPSSMLRSYF